MTARLGAVIEATLRAPGVVAAVLADSAGLAVEGASWTDGDLATAARSAAEILTRWASVGAELGIGRARAMVIERGGGPVVVRSAPHRGALMVVGNQSCRTGGLWRAAAQAAAALTEGMGTAAEPVMPAAGPSPDAAQDASPPGRLTSGEVVLVGAHTFRLVTKLVARLLQTKGIRSSRLRAYSPASTIIDVSLEEGATLAAIGRRCIDGLSIVAAAEDENRLVLRAADTSARRMAAPIGSPG